METFNHLPEMPALINRAIREAVAKAAYDIQAHAAANAPVDTGMLKSSVYVVLYDKSTYGEGVSGDPANLLPEVDRPANDMTAFIAVGATYGLYVEFGTAHGPAQPYLIPALEFVAPQFEKALSRLEERLGEEMGGL